MMNYRNGEIDYLSIFGNKKDAYKQHKECMRKSGKPCVTYASFCNRISRGWNLYRAIHTPCYENMTRRGTKKRLKVLKDFFKRW